MPVLSARRLAKAHGAITLLRDVSLTIADGESVGLLGVNGAGKSTLLEILAGVEPPDEGVIDRAKDASILYLAQEPVLDADKTARRIVEEGLAEWNAATRRHHELSKLLDDEHTAALVAEQSALAERIEHLGGWSRGHVADEMLSKLGVRDKDRAVGSMSGGERRRVALAHVLVARPDLAILDEPTNHLDTATIEWLEGYLADEWKGAVLMVTHDRYVLDAVCNRVLELERGDLVEYAGGYGDYLEQKAERLAHAERAEANRLNLLRREKAWLMRGARARTTKQKARIQRAEALMEQHAPAAAAQVELTGLERGASDLGQRILDLDGVSLELAGRKLVDDLTLHLVAGDRVGVIGPNGAGKTTLLRAILGELAPASGSVALGTRTRIAFFDQARAALNDDWSILDNVAEREGADRTGAGVVKFGVETLEVRTYLERFLFEGIKQRQRVGSLSGGERARVALAKLLKGGANLLLLDEPTNDLDVATLSALEELLVAWPGCVLAVSHDRWFLDRVATSVLVFEECGRVVRYPGNYSTYLSLRPRSERTQTAPPPPAKRDAPLQPSGKRRLTYAERIELEGILDVIAAAEGRAAALEARLASPEVYASAESKRVLADLELARGEVARLTARWEDLESRAGAPKTG